jgi:integrase/recombinase XerD
MSDLVPVKRPRTAVSVSGNVVVPAAIADAGEHAVRRFLEFFAATIRNRNTREAYYRACCSFFAWLDLNGITELADIEPIHVAAYIEALQATNAKPTVKQHLAAVRMLFDYLVVGQVLGVNPAHAVRGPKHVVKRGKTPVLIADDARRLLDSIAVTRKAKTPDGSEIEIPCVVGLRDRALIAVMTYALAHRRRRRHARRRLLPAGQALVGPPARERRQAARDAGAP